MTLPNETLAGALDWMDPEGWEEHLDRAEQEPRLYHRRRPTPAQVEQRLPDHLIRSHGISPEAVERWTERDQLSARHGTLHHR